MRLEQNAVTDFSPTPHCCEHGLRSGFGQLHDMRVWVEVLASSSHALLRARVVVCSFDPPKETWIYEPIPAENEGNTPETPVDEAHFPNSRRCYPVADIGLRLWS